MNILTGMSGSRATRTRTALDDATVAALREDGSFTTEQVAEVAGVSVATVYNRVPEGRDGLLAGALDLALDRLVEVTAEALTVEHLLDEGLDCVLRHLAEGLVGVFDEEALVLRAALARLPESRLLREVYRERQAEAQALNRRFVELGQAAGRIGDGDPDELADTLVVLCQGLNNPVLLGSADRPALVERLVSAMATVLQPAS